MAALLLLNPAAHQASARGLRTLLVRVGHALDALVSARAARAVPEWQMQEVQSQISRYCSVIQTADPVAQSNIEPVSGWRLRKTGIS